jgi:hypothetical protein
VLFRSPEQTVPDEQRRADEEAMVALLNCVAASLWTVAHGAVQLVHGTFDTSIRDVRHGLLYVLELDIYMPLVECDFPPGYLSDETRTWPLESATALVTEQLLTPTGVAFNSVTFTAAIPTGTSIPGDT